MRLAWLLAAMAVPVWAVEPQLPVVRVERLAGGPAVFVHNPTGQPLTAVCLAVAEHPFWEEEIREPVPAGADRRIDIAALPPGVTAGQVKVQAAVYADGTLAGNPAAAEQLVRRRWFVMDTVRELIRRIEKAQHDSVAKATVIGDLKVWADSLKPAPDAGEFDQKGINEAAARTLILNTIGRIGATQSYSNVLMDLMRAESDIASSRPLISQLHL